MAKRTCQRGKTERGGRTKVRPYNTLQLNALQKPLQKGGFLD